MLKTFSQVDKAARKDTTTSHPLIKVCMHVRGVVRLDPRVMREATALKKAGFAVSIVDIESESNRPAEENIDGIYVKHIHKPEWLIRATNLKPQRFIKSVQKLIISTFRLIQDPVDIYHAHDVNALLPCYIAAQLRRKLLIFDAHEMPLYELETIRRTWVHALITQVFISMIRRCAGVITVSSPIVQEMFSRYHISEVTIVRNIPAYRVVQKSNLLRQNLGLNSNIRIVLYQGNLQPDRNLDKLVKAATFLDRDIVIVLMGKGVGSTSSELQALAAREGVTDRLKIIPPVPYEELLDWTASADMGVIVSSPDYSLNVRMFLPNKLFEYLMAGLPVLSSPLLAILEVVNTYSVGEVLLSLEPKDIGTKINTVLANRIKFEQMQRNALEAVKNEFCWEKESQKLIHLYQDILARHKEQLRWKKIFSVFRYYNLFRRR